MANAAILSAQEQAIESGKTIVHGTVTDRVLRMYKAIRAYGPPRVSLDGFYLRGLPRIVSFFTQEGNLSLELPADSGTMRLRLAS